MDIVLPTYAQATGQMLDSEGVRWTFDDTEALGDTSKRAQVRSDGHLSPTNVVRKYKLAMSRGEKFPPRIKTADGYWVAGNTRTEAARELGWTAFPTFTLTEINYESAPPSVIKQVKMLAVKTNAIHGQHQSSREIEDVILENVDKDDTPEYIAARMGISASTVRNVLKMKAARERANDAGIDVNDETLVLRSNLKLMGSKIISLNMEPWVAFLNLIKDTAMPTAETSDIAKRLEGLSSDEEKLELISTERSLRDEQVRIIQGGGRPIKPSKPGRLRQHLGFVEGDVGKNPESFTETDAAARDAYLQSLRRSVDILNKVITAQLRVM